MGPEATAAIVGAAVGSASVFIGQAVVGWWNARRIRRVAAQLIFAELTIGLANARTGLATGDWPNPVGSASRSAWDNYGHLLLTRAGVADVGTMAAAYSALDDAAWLATKGPIKDADAINWIVRRIEEGLVALAEQTGESRSEVERRVRESQSRTPEFVEEVKRREAEDRTDGLEN